MRARLGLAGLGVVLAATFAAASQSAPPPVSISGSVVDGVSGAPVAGADVIVSQLVQRGTRIYGDGPQATAMTDAGGRFTITGPPVGRLRMRVRKAGYLVGLPDQLGPSDTFASGFFFLEVAAGDQVTDITVRLWRTSTISGVVESEARDPLVGESVLLLQRPHDGSGSDFALGGAPTQTDDRGRFQFLDVRPGEYYLLVPSAQPAGQRLAAPPHPSVYFPAALRMDGASVLRIGSDETLEGMNVTVAAGGEQHAVAGRLIGPPDRIRPIEVSLVDADSPRELARYAGVRVRSDADGGFRFPAVLPGRYRLLVNVVSLANSRSALNNTVSESDDPVLWADELVEVDARDVTDLEVALKAGARIRGRLMFDSTRPPPAREELLATSIRIVPSNGSFYAASAARVAADGSFASIGLAPGVYSLAWNRPALDGWHPSTVRADGRDVGGAVELGTADLNVEFHVEARPTTLAGSVGDRQGRPTTMARVLVFPRDPSRRTSDRAMRLVRQVVVNSRGRFSEQIFPGDYLVAAVTSVPTNWSAPEFLESLAPRATRATVTKGQQVDLSLRVMTTP